MHLLDHFTQKNFVFLYKKYGNADSLVIYLTQILCKLKYYISSEMLAMELIEKRISGEVKYKGVIVNVTLDQAELCDGTLVKREVVHHPGGVTVLPIDDEGYCYLVRQYRYPVGDALLETPAGKLDHGEEHFGCAVRELSEETGFTADNYVDLGCFFTSPGYSDEIIHAYPATGLHAGDSHPDEGEFLHVEKMEFSGLLDLILNGKIEDAKTVISALRAKQYLDTRK